MPLTTNETYHLGDGLYASFDGYQICLRAPREDGDHVVFLEPQLWDILIEFAAECWPAVRERLIQEKTMKLALGELQAETEMLRKARHHTPRLARNFVKVDALERD